MVLWDVKRQLIFSHIIDLTALKLLDEKNDTTAYDTTVFCRAALNLFYN